MNALFAGGPADAAYRFLNAGRIVGTNMLVERLAGRFGINFDSEHRLGIKWFLLNNLGGLWVLLEWTQFLYADIEETRLDLTILGLLTPFKIFSTLQHQGQ